MQDQDCNRNFNASFLENHSASHAELSNFCSPFLFDLHKRLGIFSVYFIITSSSLSNDPRYGLSMISKKFGVKISVGIFNHLVQKFMLSPMLSRLISAAIFILTFTKAYEYFPFLFHDNIIFLQSP